MSFWENKIQPIAPELPRADGQAYQEMRRQVSGSAIYRPGPTPEQRAAARPQRYVENPYQGLTGYMKDQHSKFEPGNETPDAYLRRVDNPRNLQNLEEHLDPAVFTRVKAAIEAARAHVQEHGIGSHDQLRERLGHPKDIGTGGIKYGYHGGSVIGNGVGIFDLDPGQRAATLEASRSGNSRIPAGMAEVRAAVNAREAAQRGQQPQHADVSALRASGAGFVGIDRG